MNISSTYKILYLLNLLFEKQCTKNDIIDEFKKHNLNINKPTINRYISVLENNDFDIKTLKIKNKNLYELTKNEKNLFFTKEEIETLNDIKKLIISKKDYTTIRKTIRLFLKFAKFIQDPEQREELLHFGYFSQINWHLILQLEKHCKNKDVISLDYMLPHGGNKTITMHTDSISISESTDKIYLNGTLDKAKHFSHLPIDRIFGIKKLLREHAKFEIETEIITYIVGNEIFDEVGKDSIETIIKKDKKCTTVQRPIEDSFSIMQRLMYFCPDLYYISDGNTKTQIQEKLKLLEISYGEESDE